MITIQKGHTGNGSYSSIEGVYRNLQWFMKLHPAVWITHILAQIIISIDYVKEIGKEFQTPGSQGML